MAVAARLPACMHACMGGAAGRWWGVAGPTGPLGSVSVRVFSAPLGIRTALPRRAGAGMGRLLYGACCAGAGGRARYSALTAAPARVRIIC
uniref:Uncharacterized protein n=1 Tax=Hordeum vulgare subsp. vulgare TaxID=112509 RepID=A0A8I6XYX1_HORVV